MQSLLCCLLACFKLACYFSCYLIHFVLLLLFFKLLFADSVLFCWKLVHRLLTCLLSFLFVCLFSWLLVFSFAWLACLLWNVSKMWKTRMLSSVGLNLASHFSKEKKGWYVCSWLTGKAVLSRSLLWGVWLRTLACLLAQCSPARWRVSETPLIILTFRYSCATITQSSF